MGRKTLWLQQAEDIYTCLLDEHKPAALAFPKFLKTVKPVPVDYFLDENSEWPLKGEVDVISIPGYTPGHISLYLKKRKRFLQRKLW